MTSLAKGAAAVDRDGDDVGVIEELHLDADSGELRGVVVRMAGALPPARLNMRYRRLSYRYALTPGPTWFPGN